jgi:predicted dehydrogenase
MKFNREMKRICDGGTLGKILFAEGEYNHPGNPYNAEFKKEYNYFPHHWRNFLPRTYYITHSLGPVMRATGATPVRVSAFAAFAPIDENAPSFSYSGDRAAVIMTQNDDGSIFRITGCAGFGAHENSYRVCGTEGQIENVRGEKGRVLLRYNKWSTPEGKEDNSTYNPAWNDPDEALIKKADHGGGDFLVIREFFDCIREGRRPEFDVYFATTMASVGILAHRSLLERGVPYDIPDFHDEAQRTKYENDRLTPFVGADGSAPTLPCCSHPDYKPSAEELAEYEALLQRE